MCTEMHVGYFQKLPYHFLQNPMKGQRPANYEIFIAYVGHLLPACDRKVPLYVGSHLFMEKPANFPESGFSWMKFRRHMHFYVTLWHANHCGRSVPFRSTHSHWQSTDTSPLKEVKWDMFIMKHYAIITYSMIKQSLLSRSVKQTKISWFIYYINTHFVNLVCLRNALTVFACGYSRYGTTPSELSHNGS